jgi:toxin ParE1/3/4
MRYRLSRKASEDIANLYLQGRREFGEKQAETYYSGLADSLAVLAKFPRMARERVELDPPVRMHRYQSHIVIYVIEDAGIVILRVRHGREDWESFP